MTAHAAATRSSVVRPVAPSAVEELVESIRALIADDGLGVGDHLLSERELCERFSTSRNTVREAMSILKAYGVVDVRPKVGAIIVDNRMERMFDLFSFNSIEISRKTFEDIQGFRSMIEVDSVERIFDRFGEADVKDLRAINQEMRDAGTIASAAEADYAFHLRLVSILGNEAVSELYRIIKPVIMRIIERGKDYEEFASRVFCEHERILVALEARKRIDYQYALQTHLTMGLRNFGDSGGI